MSALTGVLLGVVLLAVNGFFVAAEFALVSARRHRLEEIAVSGGRMAKITARAAVRGGRELSLMLAGAQLGITLASLGLGMVAEPAIEHLLEPVLTLLPESLRTPVAYVVALALVTFLHMVVGEMAPKSLALTHPERAAMGLALPFRGFAWVVRPILALLNAMTNGILRLAGVRPRDELATTRTPRQLAMLVAESGRMGMLDRDEHDLLIRALRVHSQPVERLMVPVGEALSVPENADDVLVRCTAARGGGLRMLVVTPDDVVGVLHVRDAVLQPGRRAGELAIPVPRMAKDTTISDAVTLLQEARAQLGLVTDAEGTPVGVIDLTTLVGELLAA
ncbi:hemolysin family protein [Microbispora hainanensis]|uniref:Hemolysin family protein n=1 Tax=Microbispora hainanensis TaxID=568844 RepID=A0ABZ1SLM7_9ACTN|nr:MULTISPECIES: hemolysin family protein [Microbispora]NJP26748.1 HlyC/CorC family transporter [Microbispora sp. CL1-1]TQS11951.1 HlyC/CorC family transporter [Microbispora sp. SCL1-1]